MMPMIKLQRHPRSDTLSQSWQMREGGERGVKLSRFAVGRAWHFGRDVAAPKAQKSREGKWLRAKLHRFFKEELQNDLCEQLTGTVTRNFCNSFEN